MTPQEKATELLTKYRRHLPINTVTDLEAKVCALIAVDEIMKIVPSVYVTDDNEIHSGHRQYWEEVKQEIEKL
jgi:hypothetical protein